MPRSAMSGMAPPISQARALVQPNTDWALHAGPGVTPARVCLAGCCPTSIESN